MDKNSSTKEVLAIDSIGLVNCPNLIKTALNEEEQQEDLETLKEEARNNLKELSLNYEAKEDALKELNRKNSFLEDENQALKDELRDLKISLAVEQNKILPKDINFCKSLNDDQLQSYIKNNHRVKQNLAFSKRVQDTSCEQNSNFIKELNTNIDVKEPKDINFVRKAIAAGSK